MSQELTAQPPLPDVQPLVSPYQRRLASYSRRLKFILNLMLGKVTPLASNWFDREVLIHRVYLEQFLERHAEDIKGHCLEFEEDAYTSRFGGNRVTKLDLLHHEEGNPKATLVADLTKPNDIPSNTFDCIICTYVLHVVPEPDKIVADMHRILKPGGVLLVAVPDITVNYPGFDELWRFTPKGLQVLLARYFGETQVESQPYGNALIAVRELYGLGAGDCKQKHLNYHDPRYAIIVCARAVKQ